MILDEWLPLEEKMPSSLSVDSGHPSSEEGEILSKEVLFEQFLETLILDYRDVNFQAVSDLKIFRGIDIPEMKNGHVSDDISSVKRMLIVRHKNSLDIIGAIYFEINLSDRVVTVNRCAILDKEQSKGIGSFLLESAILISMLYGTETVCLETSSRGITLYTKHGFYMDIRNNNTMIRLESAKDIWKVEYQMDDCPKLELSIPHSFNILASFMSLPGLTRDRYNEFRQWPFFEKRLMRSQKNITSFELKMLKKEVKIPVEILDKLDEKHEKPLSNLAKRHRQEGEEPEFIKNKLPKNSATDNLDTHGLFSSKFKTGEHDSPSNSLRLQL